MFTHLYNRLFSLPIVRNTIVHFNCLFRIFNAWSENVEKRPSCFVFYLQVFPALDFLQKETEILREFYTMKMCLFWKIFVIIPGANECCYLLYIVLFANCFHSVKFIFSYFQRHTLKIDKWYFTCESCWLIIFIKSKIIYSIKMNISSQYFLRL